jgi:hypothetical protein
MVPMKTPVVTASMDPPPVYSKVSPVVKAPSIATAPRASSKRKQGSVRSYKTTSPNLPVASSSSLPSLVHAKRDPDEDSIVSNTSKKSKKTTASEKQRAMEEGYDEFLANQTYDDPNMCMGDPPPPQSVSETIADRRHRNLLAKIRPKFDKTNWNGMSNTFRAFKNAVEGHLYQIGASYLFNKTFVDIYKDNGDECFKSDVVWKMYKTSHLQMVSDKELLFGILVSCTTNLQHKIILKYEATQNGILAWMNSRGTMSMMDPRS